MDALILVDIQNDFLPDGALPVPDSDAVIPVANALMRQFELIVATQDWHPPDHKSFASQHPGRSPLDVIELNGRPQVLWPDHCVQDSYGAEFAHALDVDRITMVFRKGMNPEVDSYSGFFDNDRQNASELEAWFCKRQVTSVFVAGLATDYCVKATVLDALSLGFETRLVAQGCRGVGGPDEVAAAIREMRYAGAQV